MSNYYGDDFGDRMEADELMAQLQERARAADKAARLLAFYRETMVRAATEGRALTSWKVGSKRKAPDHITPTEPGDLEREWVGCIVHPNGRLEGPNADKWQAALDADYDKRHS